MGKFSVVVKPKARADLEDIWLYSRQNWGLDQADRYIGTIDSQFALLANNPGIGRPCGHIRENYYRLEVEKHIVFYTIEENKVIIVRILHQKMDVSDHL